MAMSLLWRCPLAQRDYASADLFMVRARSVVAVRGGHGIPTSYHDHHQQHYKTLESLLSPASMGKGVGIGPGRSWAHLGAPVCSWMLLGAPVCSWALLGLPGRSWGLLGAPRRSWTPLGAPGRSWALLGAAGCSWALLVSVSSTSVQHQFNISSTSSSTSPEIIRFLMVLL